MPGMIMENIQHKLFNGFPIISEKQHGKETKLPSHMTDDYISYVSEYLPQDDKQINVEAVKRNILHDNYFSVFQEMSQAYDHQKYKDDVLKWIRQYHYIGNSLRDINSGFFKFKELVTAVAAIPNEKMLFLHKICKFSFS